MNSTKEKNLLWNRGNSRFSSNDRIGRTILVANHLIGTNDTSTEIFTRATYPNGFLLVIFIPLVATAVLFYGIIRKNSMQRQLMFASAEPLLFVQKAGTEVLNSEK